MNTFTKDRVVLNLTRAQFSRLLFTLAIAGGVAYKSGEHNALWVLLQMADELNQGNPEWRPYNVTPVEAAAVCQ
jgi:hypothetical protein